MLRTTCSFIQTRELVQFVMARDLRTEMEVELALNMIEEGDDS